MPLSSKQTRWMNTIICSMVELPHGDWLLFAVVVVVFRIAGPGAKLLVFQTESGMFLFGAWSVRLVSLRLAFGWDLFSAWLSSCVGMTAAWGTGFLESMLTKAKLVDSFPCRRRSGSVDVRSALLICRRGGSSASAYATSSNVWSCAAVMTCGTWTGASPSLLVFLCWRCDGKRRPPELKKKGPLYACVVFSLKSRGFFVIWVCSVLSVQYNPISVRQKKQADEVETVPIEIWIQFA